MVKKGETKITMKNRKLCLDGFLNLTFEQMFKIVLVAMLIYVLFMVGIDLFY